MPDDGGGGLRAGRGRWATRRWSPAPPPRPRRCRPRRCWRASRWAPGSPRRSGSAGRGPRGCCCCTGIGAPPEAPRPGTPLAAHLAEPDPFDEEEWVAWWRDTAAARGLAPQLWRYPGVGHLFTDAAIEEHDPRPPPCSGAGRRAFSPTSDGRGPLPAEKETRIGMTPKDASAYAREICGLAPVIPVLVVHDVAHAVPLAEALVAGGLPVLEVTLRTPAALEVIRAMAEVAGGVVGAGTLLTPADVKAAKAAGALFGVSPGITDTLVAACEDGGAAAPRRHRHRRRGDADARARLRGLQVLPGRGERRRAGAQVLRRAAAAGELLPDRRGDDEERAATTSSCRTCSASAAPGWPRRRCSRRAAGTRSTRLATRSQQAREVRRWQTHSGSPLTEAGRGRAGHADPVALRARPGPVQRLLGAARRHAARLLQDRDRRARR